MLKLLINYGWLLVLVTALTGCSSTDNTPDHIKVENALLDKHSGIWHVYKDEEILMDGDYDGDTFIYDVVYELNYLDELFISKENSTLTFREPTMNDLWFTVEGYTSPSGNTYYMKYLRRKSDDIEKILKRKENARTVQKYLSNLKYEITKTAEELGYTIIFTGVES